MILVLGKGGQLSTALQALLGGRARAVGMEEANFGDADFIAKLTAVTRAQHFTAVMNAAAYTQVDKAEGEKAVAMRVNGTAVGELAGWCKERGLPLVHFSTDYVFDGSGNRPWRESDKVNPLNVYGESKLLGETLLAESGAKYLTFRTSWVYDAHGKNFVNTIIRLLGEREQLKVVDDQVGAPTYAPHLARASVAVLEAAMGREVFPYGLYHLCNGGDVSWCGFAKAIFALASARDSGLKCQRIDPIPSTEYPLPARRSLNSRLDCSKAKDTFGISLPGWQDGLNECFKEKYGRAGL